MSSRTGSSTPLIYALSLITVQQEALSNIDKIYMYGNYITNSYVDEEALEFICVL